jgi:hypothetical protein
MAYGTSSRGQSYGVCSTVPLELEPIVVVVFNLGYIHTGRPVGLFDLIIITFMHIPVRTGMLWQQPAVLQRGTGAVPVRIIVVQPYLVGTSTALRYVVDWSWSILRAAILNTCRALLYRSK